VFFIVLSCLLVIFHSTVDLDLSDNSLTGTIPSQIAMMSNLSESSIVWLLVVMIVLSCVFFNCTLMLAFMFHSIDYLWLINNNFTGTIPSQIAMMSNLCESCVAWLLVVMIVLSCVFHCTLMLAFFFHSTAWLSLYNNSLTGTIPSEVGLLPKLSESSIVWLLVAMIVLSLYSHACL
jgi:hypothetical protein